MFSVLGKLGWFFKENKKKYLFAIIALGIVNLVEIWPPKLIGMAIDDIYLQTLTKHDLLMYIGVLIVILIVSYIFSYIWQYQLFGGSYILEKNVRGKLMNHLLKMTPTFYQKNRTGDLMARGTNDLRAISMTAGFGILTLIDSTMFMGVILFMMAVTISWKLTLVAIIPLPILAIILRKYGNMLHSRFIKAQDAFGDMNDKVLESIAGVRVIRAYVQEKEEQMRFHDMALDVFEKNRRVALIDALFEPTLKILVGTSYLLGIVFGSYLVFKSEMTLGQLVSFNVYLNMLVWPMMAIGDLINIMQRGNASLDRVEEILQYEQDVKDKEETVQVDIPTTIQFEDVSFSYPNAEVKAIKHVTFTINKGETIGIVGKTGSGKTTIIRQLLRQYPIDTGDILIGENSIEQLSTDNMLKWIGYVPQEHILFSKSVEENILYGNEELTESDLTNAIQLASFEKDITFLHDGLETLVGEKGVSLSGGQKQRISIARALAINPEILILDDSLSAVDAQTEKSIIQNIRTERAGKTTIITAHRLSAVQHADKIIVLDDGEITQIGDHNELMTSGGWYKDQFENQQITSDEEVRV